VEAIVTMPDGEQHEMPFQQRRIKNRNCGGEFF